MGYVVYRPETMMIRVTDAQMMTLLGIMDRAERVLDDMGADPIYREIARRAYRACQQGLDIAQCDRNGCWTGIGD